MIIELETEKVLEKFEDEEEAIQTAVNFRKEKTWVKIVSTNHGKENSET
jgi:hypothetical protein